MSDELKKEIEGEPMLKDVSIEKDCAEDCVEDVKEDDSKNNLKKIKNQEVLQEVARLTTELGDAQVAMQHVLNKKSKEDMFIEMRGNLRGFKNEVAYAMFEAVKKIFGYVDLNPRPGISGPNNPEYLTIKKPDGSEIRVPFGRISLPHFDADSYIELEYNYNDVSVTVLARVRKKFEDEVSKIISEAEKMLQKNSIYKGQAFSIEFDNDGDALEPRFLGLDNIDSSKILFSKEVEDGLVPIVTRITKSEMCVKQGLDLKLGVLMEGPYGTGKTLTAFHIGKIASENNWTFIYLKNCKDLAQTLRIAENYCKGNQGVVLFTEDIDQTIRGERGQTIQDIVNTLDGGDTKNLPIISIFTTNHIELIEPTFLRGKRIGSLIHFGELDMDTATQFIEKLVVDSDGNSIMEKKNREIAAEALCGIVPAFASEVIDKAKAYMISRGGNKISSDDIVLAAESYKDQMSYAECVKHDKSKDDIINALTLINHVMSNGSNEDIKEQVRLLSEKFDTHF